MPKHALLVIDVQNEYFDGKLPVTYPTDTLPRILATMDAAAEAGVPVVVVQHGSTQPEARTFREGSREWELHPEIAARPHDLLLHKTKSGSFTGTGLEEWLREHEIENVVISGYMTQMCCDTTARQASHRGFGATFLSDATGTLAVSNVGGSVTAEELHRAILVAQAMGLSAVMTADEWLAQLAETPAS